MSVAFSCWIDGCVFHYSHFLPGYFETQRPKAKPGPGKGKGKGKGAAIQPKAAAEPKETKEKGQAAEAEGQTWVEVARNGKPRKKVPK